MHIHANMQNLISPQLVARVVVSFDFNCTPVVIRALQMGAVFVFDGGLCADYVLNLLFGEIMGRLPHLGHRQQHAALVALVALVAFQTSSDSTLPGSIALFTLPSASSSV